MRICCACGGWRDIVAHIGVGIAAAKRTAAARHRGGAASARGASRRGGCVRQQQAARRAALNETRSKSKAARKQVSWHQRGASYASWAAGVPRVDIWARRQRKQRERAAASQNIGNNGGTHGGSRGKSKAVRASAWVCEKSKAARRRLQRAGAQLRHRGAAHGAAVHQRCRSRLGAAAGVCGDAAVAIIRRGIARRRAWRALSAARGAWCAGGSA